MTPRSPSIDRSTPAVLVLGATGGIGRGIVEALLAAGQPVIAVGRDPAALAELATAFAASPLLTLLPADLGGEDGGAALVQALRRLRRPLRAAVASLGGPFVSGRLMATSTTQALDKLQADLAPHWTAARHLLPLMAERNHPSRYLVIGAPCADHVWAGYGLCSIGSAALRMFVRALREETADGPVRVQQLVLAGPVATWRNAACACADWPRAVEVGRRVLALLDSADTRTLVLSGPRHGQHAQGITDCTHTD